MVYVLNVVVGFIGLITNATFSGTSSTHSLRGCLSLMGSLQSSSKAPNANVLPSHDATRHERPDETMDIALNLGALNIMPDGETTRRNRQHIPHKGSHGLESAAKAFPGKAFADPFELRHVHLFRWNVELICIQPGRRNELCPHLSRRPDEMFPEPCRRYVDRCLFCALISVTVFLICCCSAVMLLY